MAKPLLALAILFAAASGDAAQPARLLYQRARAEEQAARAALATPAPAESTLPALRRAIAAYEAVVRRHPASPYADDALWQGGRLALDAFARFGDSRDARTALRLLRLLASDYPTSRFAAPARAIAARSTAPRDTAPTGPVAAPGRASSEPRAAAAASVDLRAAASPARRQTEPAPSVRAQNPQETARAAAARSAFPSELRPATITAIRRAVLPDVVRVTIALDREVAFRDERIEGPPRIFVDFPTTRTAPSLADRTLRFDADGDLVRQVRIGRHDDRTTRVVLDANGVSSYSVYPLYNPYRLVIDCVRAGGDPARAAAAGPGPGAAPAPGAASEAPLPGAAGSQSRAALAISPRTDVAADHAVSARPARSESESVAPPAAPRLLPARPISFAAPARLPAYGPAATRALKAAYVPPLSVRPVSGDWRWRGPELTPGSTALLEAAYVAPLPVRAIPGRLDDLPAGGAIAAAAIAEALATRGAPSELAASSTPAPGSRLSMARQLGLGVSRIVIDPGHGGHDPGAKGKGGLTEAELVLDVSLRLRKLLEKMPGTEVVLTRDADCFVPLQERTAIANREAADLFLSIHANASANDQARGVETYVLNFANNLSAAAVAARENAASGQAMGALPDLVKAIALNNKLDESRQFASLVQQALVARLAPANKSVRNLGVKQAPFVVLIGASMPSVLAEISFVTNPQEAKLLKSGSYRERIAEALFDAIRQYQSSLARPQSAAVH